MYVNVFLFFKFLYKIFVSFRPTTYLLEKVFLVVNSVDRVMLEIYYKRLILIVCIIL